MVVANSVGRPEIDNTTLPGTGSQSATDLLNDKLPEQANGSVPIVLQSGTSLAQGQNMQAVESTAKSLSENQYVQSVVSPFDPQGAAQITKDGKIAYLAVALKVSSGDLDDDEANSVFDAAQPARDAGIKVSAGGYLGQQLSSPSTGLSEIIGVLAALIILLFAFRTFVAAPLPVTTAIVALACGLAIVGLAGNAIDVPSIAPTLGIMLGLAVGTDYSLFIISRHLRFLEEGVEPDESIARSIGTSGSAVVFAGMHGDHRPALPLLQRHPPGPLARLHDGDRRRHGRPCRDHVPSRGSRPARQADPQAAVPLRQAQARCGPPGRLVQVGRRDPQSPRRRCR